MQMLFSLNAKDIDSPDRVTLISTFIYAALIACLTCFSVVDNHSHDSGALIELWGFWRSLF